MARRNHQSILEDFAILPWWLNLIVAAIVYVALKYWVPSIAFENPFYKGMASAGPSIAPVEVFVFLSAAVVSAFNAWRKGKLFGGQKGIETLRAISWQEFEELVGKTYRRKGYSVTECGGGGADGGVDLVLGRSGEKLLVQCKHWKMDKIGVKVVRELYGVVAAEGATGGIVISSGAFTQEAKDFARGKPMELIDGPELLRLIADVQKTTMLIEKKTPESTENICPVCGGDMVLRKAKKGSNVGESFWGCSAYPRCRGTKPYRATHL